MVPLGTDQSWPLKLRTRVIRRPTSSITPVAPFTWATSPTRITSSRMRKNPLMTSFTRLWAPKPTARPRTPAPARIAPTLMPSWERAMTRPTPTRVTLTRPRRIPARVSLRRRMVRAAARETTEATIQAPTAMAMATATSVSRPGA